MVEPLEVLAEAVKDRLRIGERIELRVQKYFPRVPDFARDEEGRVIKTSLAGPARVEAKEQLVREKLVATEETKMLKEEVTRCYRREGVNHRETCRRLVEAYAAKLSADHYGMMRVRATQQSLV